MKILKFMAFLVWLPLSLVMGFQAARLATRIFCPGIDPSICEVDTLVLPLLIVVPTTFLVGSFLTLAIWSKYLDRD